MHNHRKTLRRLGAGAVAATVIGVVPVIVATSASAAAVTTAVSQSNSAAGSSSNDIFTITPTTALTAGTSKITVSGLSGFTFPTTASSYAVTGTATPPTQATLTGGAGGFSFILPSGATTSPVTVTVTGVVNPSSAGLYTGAVQTYADGTTLSDAGSVTINISSAATTQTITSVNPPAIPAGGAPITIHGTGFTGQTTATVGGTAVTGFTVVNDTTITATAPSQAAGASYNVVVGSATATGALRYAAGLTTIPQSGERILDTRVSGGQITGALQPGSTYTVVVAGNGNVPTGATAAVLNVTEVGGTSGNLRVYDADATTAPTVSTVNYQSGQDVANTVIVPLGSTVTGSGRVALQTFGSTANVIVDVTGYQTAAGTFTPAGTGTLGTTTPPTGNRVYDSRTSGTALTNASPIVVPLSAGVHLLNVTAIAPTGPGNLRVFTTPATTASGVGTAPSYSTVNYITGVDKANTVLVTTGAGGNIAIEGFGGTANVAVDDLGVITGTTAAAGRVFDTRTSTFGALTPGTPQVVTNVAGATTGIFANVTTINPAGTGNVRAYAQTASTAAATPAPSASTVNLIPGQDVANFALIPVSTPPSGTGQVFDLQSFGSKVDVAVDSLATL